MTHPKNNEYVAKHRKKAREDMGDEAYKKKEAEARALRRQKEKAAKEEKAKTAAKEEKAKTAEKEEHAKQVLKTKINTINYVNDMLNTLLPKVINAIPEKRKVGRPKKPRNPIGRPPDQKISLNN